MNCECSGSNGTSTNTTSAHDRADARVDPRSRAEPAPTFLAPVDVYETGDAVVVVADVPGARPANIDATFEDGVLTVAARIDDRTPGTPGDAVLREYRVGDFRRTIRVGHEVDSARISAKVTSGVLTVTLPKSPAAQARKIAVSGN